MALRRVELLNLNDSAGHIADTPQSLLATPVLASDELHEQHQRATESFRILIGKQGAELKVQVALPRYRRLLDVPITGNWPWKIWAKVLNAQRTRLERARVAIVVKQARGQAWPLCRVCQGHSHENSDSQLIAVNSKSMRKGETSEEINQLVARALNWLASNEFPNEFLKWQTEAWGEVPADYGRK